jgi:hypothetical protein
MAVPHQSHSIDWMGLISPLSELLTNKGEHKLCSPLSFKELSNLKCSDLHQHFSGGNYGIMKHESRRDFSDGFLEILLHLIHGLFGLNTIFKKAILIFETKKRSHR